MEINTRYALNHLCLNNTQSRWRERERERERERVSSNFSVEPPEKSESHVPSSPGESSTSISKLGTISQAHATFSDFDRHILLGQSEKLQMSSLEQEIFLRWGNKKRVRCLRAKDKQISRESNSSLRRRNSSRFLGHETFLFQSSRFSRGSEGAILRSGLQDRRRSSPEKEERYYTTRGVVDNIGKACLEGNNGDDSNKEEESMWPKLFITLSSKEKEEDFMAMKGCKPSHRPKKRAKLIQRSLLLVSPGTWLADLCPDRYDIRVKKSCKKRRARGLKAMGNMESDSD